jgi:hypothetical protein
LEPIFRHTSSLAKGMRCVLYWDAFGMVQDVEMG